eukprot:6200225-Pleurochrysis_carterae.AAC.2
MPTKKKQLLLKRANSFLEAAEACYLKWARRVRRYVHAPPAHHLLGILTCEERRSCIAAELLKVLGCEQTLKAALAEEQESETTCDEAQGGGPVRALTPAPPVPKVTPTRTRA